MENLYHQPNTPEEQGVLEAASAARDRTIHALKDQITAIDRELAGGTGWLGAGIVVLKRIPLEMKRKRLEGELAHLEEEQLADSLRAQG